MARLTAKDAFGALVPVTFGTVTLSGIEAGAVTWLAPLAGKAAEVSAALAAQVGAGLPEAGQSLAAAGGRVVWAGPGQAFVIGPDLTPIDGAAQVDHTSAWARMALEGADAEAVLARLVPVDLRAAAFGEGATARTQLGHMACSLSRTGVRAGAGAGAGAGAERFEIMVFRSMAASAVHEIARAMEMVAARRALTG